MEARVMFDPRNSGPLAEDWDCMVIDLAVNVEERVGKAVLLWKQSLSSGKRFF